jgi:tetratricopeptide (TPR) repeat protein
VAEALVANEDPTRKKLDAALAAQRAGLFDDAIALYEAVFTDHPDMFDAVHMLGVAHYQRGNFERAHELVSSALRLSPSDRGARYNLRLIESILERRVVEREISRETLPRLARRCVAPPGADVRQRWRGQALDVIVSTAGSFNRLEELARLLDCLEAAAPVVWLYPPTRLPASASWPFRFIDPANGEIPAHARALFFGFEHSPAGWYPSAAAAEVALFCDHDAPSTLLDMIPELSREGRTPLLLLYASSALAREVGLPGIVVEAAARARDAVERAQR